MSVRTNGIGQGEHGWRPSAGWGPAVGRGLYTAVVAGCVLLFVGVGVLVLVRGEGAGSWGTFSRTSTECDPVPHGTCAARGRWVSDDTAVVRQDVVLAGAVDGSGTARAFYRRDDSSSRQNEVVSAVAWPTAEVWLPWIVAAGLALHLGLAWRRWRRGDWIGQQLGISWGG